MVARSGTSWISSQWSLGTARQDGRSIARIHKANRESRVFGYVALFGAIGGIGVAVAARRSPELTLDWDDDLPRNDDDRERAQLAFGSSSGFRS